MAIAGMELRAAKAISEQRTPIAGVDRIQTKSIGKEGLETSRLNPNGDHCIGAAGRHSIDTQAIAEEMIRRNQTPMNNIISGIMPDDARILIDAMEASRHKKTLLVTALDSSLPDLGFRHVIGTDVVYMGKELFRHLQQDIALGKAKKFDVQQN